MVNRSARKEQRNSRVALRSLALLDTVNVSSSKVACVSGFVTFLGSDFSWQIFDLLGTLERKQKGFESD